MGVDWDLISRAATLVLPVVYLALATWAVLEVRKWRKLAEGALDTAQVALDALDRMEEARDPGRDVHTRLAAALEASVIVHSDGPPRPDPAMRRTLAMAMAGDMIAAARRARLLIEPEAWWSHEPPPALLHLRNDEQTTPEDE